MLYHVRFVTYVFLSVRVTLANENGHLVTEDPFQDLQPYHGRSVSDGENENVFITVGCKMLLL